MITPAIVPYPSLLPELRWVIDSGALGKLWADESAWRSLSIDYHPPRVERLFVDMPNGHRVSLHRLYPCNADKALWHSHPWPSAVLVLAGKYEHSTGFVDRHGLHCNSRSILVPGASYEIVDPLAWHSVRPIDGPAYSVMLTGQPWPGSTAPKPAPQRPLTATEVEDLRRCFGDLLVWDRAKVNTAAHDQHVADGGDPRTAPDFDISVSLPLAPEPGKVAARCGAVGREACLYYDRSADECNACTSDDTATEET